MASISVEQIYVLSSFIPILWLLVSLGYLKTPADKACAIGLALSLMIAIMFYKMEPFMALKAVMEGILFGLLPIMWVILAAFFTYNVSLHTGAIETIKRVLAGFSGDRRIQSLLIAWCFGSFMEAVAGFGTAVAVPAALLIALGFDAFLAATICLFANTIAVAFGVVGIPVVTLAQITELPVMLISFDILTQLTLFTFIIPVLIVFTMTKSFQALKEVALTTLIAGGSFALAQFIVATCVGPELPAIVGSIVSFVAVILCVKFFPPQQEWKFPRERENKAKFNASENMDAVKAKTQIIAWMPYIILLILVLATSKLILPVHNILGQVKSSFLIYDGEGGKPLYFEWLLTPGSLIMISAVIGGLIQGASFARLILILKDTILQLRKTTVTILSIVSMAKVMGYSKMVGAIAVFISAAAGHYYPFFAPFIGALGTFITGSDTSSNILFGLLQKQIAIHLGLSPIWMAAANTSGACIGKLISPQSMAIAAIATGLTGKEGQLLAVVIKYAVVFLISLGFITYFFA